MNTQRFADALILGLFVLVATVPLLVLARWVHGESGQGGVANPRAATRRPLAGWQAGLTYFIAGTLVVLGVGVPVSALAEWVLDGLADPNGFAPIGGAVWDTLSVALVGGAVTVLLALAPAWLAVRGSRRTSTVVEQGTYISSALPGVLLAFGLLLAALAFARGFDDSRNAYYLLTKSGALLLVGYATRFIAEAFTGLRTAVGQLDPRQEETARALGASPTRRLVRVVAPALIPGAAVSLVLVVLAIIKELPVTLLLGGAMGLRTLSFRMFDRYQDAFLPDAGVAGLMLLGFAFVAFAISFRWRHHA